MLWQARRPGRAPAPEKPLRVALVLKERKGAGRPRPVPPPRPPARTAPARTRIATPMPHPPLRAPRGPAPSAAASPPPPALPAPPAARPRFQLNLGGSNAETNAIVHGNQVVPAKPDARFRNLEPVYPPAAVARGEQGTVVLLVHVGPDGRPSEVDIVRSSGFAQLDQAARRAVSRWHFLPAISQGEPVPAEMSLRVVFSLD